MNLYTARKIKTPIDPLSCNGACMKNKTLHAI